MFDHTVQHRTILLFTMSSNLKPYHSILQAETLPNNVQLHSLSSTLLPLRHTPPDRHALQCTGGCIWQIYDDDEKCIWGWICLMFMYVILMMLLMPMMMVRALHKTTMRQLPLTLCFAPSITFISSITPLLTTQRCSWRFFVLPIDDEWELYINTEMHSNYFNSSITYHR